MWLVAGLGNPGREYAQTRHNIGFLALDALYDRYKGSAWSKKFRGEWAELQAFAPERVLLLKPLTYMNRSGESVGEMARFYKIPPMRILVLHDELDLPCGKLRVKRGGGHGGHNGLKSIDAAIGADYGRIRIGIGRPPARMEVTPYVLGAFGTEEWAQQKRFLGLISECWPLILQGDEAGFMNKVALLAQAEKRP
jgi:PTH1 family peptidyl-tRNA hydrolase